MKPFRTLIVFAFILVVASFFRLHAIDTTPPGLYPDEAMNGNNALEAIESAPPEGGLKVFYPENNGREGLFINIQALFLQTILPHAGGNPEPWMLRLPSAFFGIATVAGIFFLTKELFKKNSIALLASFLLAVSFWHINFSRIGFRAIMAPAFLVWGIYLLILSFRKNEEFKIPNLKFKILLPLLAGAVYGLGMYSYIAYRATPLLILVIFVVAALRIGWKSMWKIAIWFVLGALVVSVPLIAYFAHNPQDFFGRTSEVSVFSSPSPLGELGINIAKTIGMLFFVGDSNWRHNLPSIPELFWPVAILFLIGIVIGIKVMIKNSKFSPYGRCPEGTQISNSNSILNDGDLKLEKLKFIQNLKLKIKNLFLGDATAFIILSAWIAIAMLPVVFSNEGIPHALRSILMIPPVFIIAGLGGVALYEWMGHKLQKPSWHRFLSVAAFLLLAFIAVTTYWNYFIVWGQDRNTAGAFSEEYIVTGRKLNAVPEHIPKYVIVEAGGVLARGIPMPTQTVMYMTNTFTKEKQMERNIHYILPKDAGSIPEGSFVVTIN